jgi:adenine-specific DNA-methyltransferase
MGRARQLALTPSTGTLRPCPEDSVDWDTTQNLMIEGDNLEVLKLLQKSYSGKVKLIYIDPPYNTGNDFVYPDDFSDSIKNYLEITGQAENGRKVSTNTEASGRFHTDWLNMMYPRLKLARNLLREDGVIFISIDDNELSNLIAVLNDVFGEENRVAVLTWVRTRTPAALSQKTKKVAEYVVCFEKSANDRPLLGIEKPAQSANTLLNQPNRVSELTFPAGAVEAGFEDGIIAPGRYGSDRYEVELLEATEVRDGRFNRPVRLRARFRWIQDYLEAQIAAGVHVRIASQRMLPSYEKDSYGREAMPNLIDSEVGVDTNEAAGLEVEALLGARVVSYPKPTKLLRYLVNSATDPAGDIVLDFFAGSGTTGHAVTALNSADGGDRRYILVQLPEPLDPENKDQKVAADFCDSLGRPRTIAELTKERLRRAGALIKAESPMFTGDLGFRAFRLDSSNIRAWEPDRDDLQQTLNESVEHLKADRSETDILYELLLKLGLDLCVPIAERAICGKSVYSVGGGVLLVCLAESIGEFDAEPLGIGIAAWYAELAPAGAAACVFRDGAFANDVAKTNLVAILHQHGLANVRSL